MKVIWSRESPERGEKFIDYLIKRGESISQNPKIGRMVPEILNPEFRENLTKNYRIVYRLKKQRIEILTVFEGHRLLRIEELNIISCN